MLDVALSWGVCHDLVRKLNAAGAGAIGLLYYSGHGAAERDTNINYLIPVDAREPGTSSLWDESVKLDDVLKLLDGARAAAKFVIFDACRNELQLPTKDTSKGLVPISEQQGMFIAYASAPGRTASDRGDKSGPYAAALAADWPSRVSITSVCSKMSRKPCTPPAEVRSSHGKAMGC
jgi:uncharacterized caspase-like protein